MLREKEIKALMDGAYGVTRDGRKALYVGTDGDDEHTWLLFMASNPNRPKEFKVGYYTFNQNDLRDYDIVGLWENRSEPFNLERALAGEPVMLKDNNLDKVYIHRRYSNTGDYIVEYTDTTDYAGLMELNEKFVMWKEPESNTDDLPKPIREFRYVDKAYVISRNNCKYIPRKITKRDGWTKSEQQWFENGLCYASEMDCQIVCSWLMNR